MSAGRLSLLYQVAGTGTRQLSLKKKGDELEIIGPLGNGFGRMPGRRPVLVAGGMGVAPLFYLATATVAQKPFVLIGAKTASDLVCEREFRRLGCDVLVATDDGSKGFHGYVTGLLQELLSGKQQWGKARLCLYACGPRPMLRETGALAAACGIPCQLSLEEHMACGFGACLGCAVQTASGYKRVCSEGPVFDSAELIW